MARKGANGLSIEVIVGLVLILAIILIVVTGVWQKYSFFIGVAKLIPGFNYTESTVGMTTLGINLDKNNELQYFTGKQWKKVDMQNGNFVLGNYEFNPNEVKKAFEDFYSSPRRPSKFNFEINSWRYWGVQQSVSSIIVYPNTKQGLVGPRTPEYGYGFYLIDAGIEDGLIALKDSSYLVPFSKFDELQSSLVFSKLIEWRDSIMANGKCEKFVGLNINENKNGFENKPYTARKLERYIFVDLSNSIDPTRVERYLNESCSQIFDYKDSRMDLKERLLEIEFYDKVSYRTFSFFFNSSEMAWELPKNNVYVDSSWYTPFTGLGQENKVRYALSGSEMSSLILGMNRIFQTGAGEIERIKITVGDSYSQFQSEKHVVGDIVYQKSEFSKEDLIEISEILYNILEKYNVVKEVQDE